MALAVWTLAEATNQLASTYKWTGNTITYGFPSSVDAMAFDEGGFTAFTAAQIANTKIALMTWDDLIKPNLQQITLSSTAEFDTADIEFGTSSNMGGGVAGYPDEGSVWITAGTNFVVGSWTFETLVHEIGHAFGLDHSGDYNGTAKVPDHTQDCEPYSIMSYFGPGGYDNPDILQVDWEDETTGDTYYPQTPMMNDIYAVQSMYGADTTTRTGNTVYGFNCNLAGDAAKIYNFNLNAHPVLTIYDAGGNDTLDLSGWNTTSKIDLNDGAFSNGNRMTYNIAIARNTVIENAKGGGGNDKLIGNEANNLLVGNNGNDSLSGGAGNDSLTGGAGNDSMTGGAGNDSYYVEQSGDTVVESSGGGVDLVHAYVNYTLAANIENARIRADGVANLTGNELSNTLYAGLGNNVISGGTGSEADTVYYAYGVTGTSGVTVSLAISGAQATGGSGSDTLVGIEKIAGSNNADRLTGSTGNNSLYGLIGNDAINGGAGNDWINGGVGTDNLVGGVGNDTFDFNALNELGLGGTRDVIAGWNTGDRIDLTTIDWNTSSAGDQAFSYVGNAAFTAIGQIRYSAGVLQINSDSDASAEYELIITGTPPATLVTGSSILL